MGKNEEGEACVPGVAVSVLRESAETRSTVLVQSRVPLCSFTWASPLLAVHAVLCVALSCVQGVSWYLLRSSAKYLCVSCCILCCGVPVVQGFPHPSWSLRNVSRDGDVWKHC